MALMAAQPDEKVLALNQPRLINPHDAHMAASLTQPIMAAPQPLDVSGMMSGSPETPDVPTTMSGKVNSPASPEGIMARNQDRLMSLESKVDTPGGGHKNPVAKFLHKVNMGLGWPQYLEQQQEDRVTGLGGEQAKQGLENAQAGEAGARAHLYEQQAEGGEPVEITPEMATQLGAPELAGQMIPRSAIVALSKQHGVNATKQQTTESTNQAKKDIATGSNQTKLTIADIQAMNKIQPTKPLMVNGQIHLMERDPQTHEYSIDRGIAPPNYAMIAPELKTYQTKDEATGQNVTKTLSGRTLGPLADTTTQRNMAEMAATVQPQMESVQDEVQSLANSIGPAAGRWNELMTNKGGADYPEFAGLDTDLDLLASAIVRTHFGARGGQQYREELRKMFGAAQSPEDLIHRIQHAESWIEGYAASGGQKTPVGRAYQGENPAHGEQPIVQMNKKTGAYRYSTDGGKTWQTGQPPSR